MNATDNEGDSALRVAVKNSNFHSVQLLIEAGANINLRGIGEWKWTALHIAVARGEQPEILELVTEARGMINFRIPLSGGKYLY